MGEEEILKLAQEFLFSEAGKRLVGQDIDLDKIKKTILSNSQGILSGIEESIYQDPEIISQNIAGRINYTGVDVTKIRIGGGGVEKPKLSREERLAQRQARRNLSRAEREQLLKERLEERARRKKEREDDRIEREKQRILNRAERERRRNLSQEERAELLKQRQIERDRRREERDKEREEDRKERQEEREENKKERAEEREARRKEREERKKARQEKGGLVGQFIPRFKEYLVNGRVYDKYRKIPISGVKVLLALKVKEPLKDTTVTIPIGGEKRVFKAEDGKREVVKRDVYTDSDGKFSIYVRLPYLPYNDKILVEPFLLYTKSGDYNKTEEELKKQGLSRIDGYLPATQPIMTREREVKTDLPEFPLVDLATAAEEELPGYLGRYYPIYDTTRKLLLNPKQQVLVLRKQQILKTVRIIQTRLLPIVVELLITFGITKIAERRQKVCPPSGVLRSNTERRNRVVRQLNQIFRQITANTAIAAALTVLANTIKVNRSIILNLPLPLGAPIGVGVPYSAVAKLQEVQDVLETLEEDNKELNKQIVNGLVLLTSSVTSILILLKLLDEMTQECAGELKLNQETISQELVDLTDEAKEEGISSTNRVNGFILEVQALDQDSLRLNRRQAVGKNSQGIIMIKGDPSFSSSDQVLINELAFYIQSNNLKAF